MKRLLFACLFLALAATAFADDYYFLSQPDISPDGQTVVFCYNGDIWQVAVTGGTAQRLTAMDGIESSPRISPDGKWLAFSGQLEGNTNVYLMPMAGGTITQLTFNDNGDNVSSWSWDSETIYFTSGRENSFTEYAVKRTGGTPTRLVNGYFNNIHSVVVNPKDGAIWFTDTWESYRFATRKGYKGAFNPDLKAYNLETKAFRVHTDWEGKDMFPTFDERVRLYFISDDADPKGGVTNLYQLEKEHKRQLTNFNQSVRNPRVSAGGSKVVFEKGYQLFFYDIGTGQVTPIKVRLFSDPSLTIESKYDVKGKITAFDVAPDGKKLAFVSRGELFVSDTEGKFIRKLETSVAGRVDEVKWLEDSQTLLFNQTVGGWYNWFTIPANGKGTATQITKGEANSRALTMNEDRTKAVYLSGRHDVKLMDLETKESKTMVEENLWGFYNSNPQFSPDDKWIVFTAYRNFETDIFLHNLETGETVNFTGTGVGESSPTFSADGKYLYFSSDRIAPGYPRGNDGTHIYRIALQKFDDVYRADEFDKLFKEEKKKDNGDKEKKDKKEQKPEKKPVVVKIDMERVLERFELVSPSRGTQYGPIVQVDDETHIVIFSSNHEGSDRSLYQTIIKPFEKRETKAIKKATLRRGGDWAIVQVKGKSYALLNGTIHTLNLGKSAVKAIDISHGFTRNMKAEFNQMFDEMWASMYENYYDENFHGRDWPAVREKYRAYLPYLTNRNDVKVLFNDMLGELNSSHQGFYSNGDEEKTFHNQRSVTVGIEFDRDNPWQVASILKDSPMDKVNKDVRAGDILVAVNDENVDDTVNRERYFRFPAAPEEMKLTFQRDGTRTFSVRVHPESTGVHRNRFYDRWEDINQARVDEKSDKRIAYIHMRNMGGSELNKFFVEMTSEHYNRDALILDLRNNTGGNVHDAVLNFLSQKLYAKWKYRGDSTMAPQPNFVPADKPIVLLINEQTLSDGEMTTAGFKALKLGTVVGTETYRWLIFTSGKGLVDGSYYRLPCWGCYTVDGTDIETHGVAPDVAVDLTVKDKDMGQDPQLDKAIDIIMDQLK